MGRVYALMKDRVHAYVGTHDYPKTVLIPPRDGLVLGTGWAARSVLRRHLQQKGLAIPFEKLGIAVKNIQGHAGVFRVGDWDCGGGLRSPVVISQGRIHRNQCGNDPELLTRWLSALLVLMGDGQRLLLTNAVGGLQPQIAVGSISVPTSAVYHHLDWRELYPGEFVTPELGLPRMGSPFNQAACQAAREAGLAVSGNTCTTMIIGPGFGGAGDRRVMGQVWGCHTVGMSPFPELGLIRAENAARKQRHRPQIRTGVVQFVSDNKAVPTHKGNQDEAKKRAPRLGRLITGIIKARW